MAELRAVEQALEGVRQDLEKQNQLRVKQNQLIDDQNRELQEVKQKLPGFVPKPLFVVAVVGLLIAGLVVAFFVFREYQRTAKDKERTTDFRNEARARDYTFCLVINYMSQEGANKNRQAIRDVKEAVQQSFELVQPAVDSSPAQRQRTNEFREKIIGKLDQVNIDGDMPQFNCKGIGNGQINFSIEDVLRQFPNALKSPGG